MSNALRPRSTRVRPRIAGAFVAGMGVLSACLVASALTITSATSASASTASAGTASASASTTSAKVPTLQWSSCGPVFRCATAKVPLDWRRPGGSTITLALSKAPATGPGRRLGTLFVNPGGPGISGVDALPTIVSRLPSSVRARFDVVAFDPRFVGESRPRATCGSDSAFSALAASVQAFPVAAPQEESAANSMAAYIAGCSSRQWLAYASTASVARDLDLLRQAVRDKKLNYLGYSYGTYLGQVYAQLFPTKVRTMVLDGVVDGQAWISGTDQQWRTTPFSARLGSADGSQLALSEFFRLCHQAGPQRCVLDDSGDPASAFMDVAKHLAAQPIDLGQGAQFDYPALINATTNVLYDPSLWTFFAAQIQVLHQEFTSLDGAVAGSSGASGEQLAAAKNRRVAAARAASTALAAHVSVIAGPTWDRATPVGTHAASVDSDAIPADNAFAAYAAIACEDTRNPSDLSTWSSAAAAQDAANPLFGRSWLWSGIACLSWTLRDPSAYTARLGGNRAAPAMLVVSTTFDPATPYAGAVATAKRYPRSVLLTVKGYGHTSMALPSKCADAALTTYLVKHRLPRAGATCRQDITPFS